MQRNREIESQRGRETESANDFQCIPKRIGERCGSVCLDNEKPRVTEYSELGPELSKMLTADGKRPLFGDVSIANHFFSLDFIKS